MLFCERPSAACTLCVTNTQLNYAAAPPSGQTVSFYKGHHLLKIQWEAFEIRTDEQTRADHDHNPNHNPSFITGNEKEILKVWLHHVWILGTKKQHAQQDFKTKQNRTKSYFALCQSRTYKNRLKEVRLNNNVEIKTYVVCFLVF